MEINLSLLKEITMDLDEEHSSKVIDSMNRRKGKLIDLKDTGKNKKRLIFHAPTRGVNGIHKQVFNSDKRKWSNQ